MLKAECERETITEVETGTPSMWEVSLVDLKSEDCVPWTAFVYADSDKGAHDVALAGRPVHIVLSDYPKRA